MLKTDKLVECDAFANPTADPWLLITCYFACITSLTERLSETDYPPRIGELSPSKPALKFPRKRSLQFSVSFVSTVVFYNRLCSHVLNDSFHQYNVFFSFFNHSDTAKEKQSREFKQNFHIILSWTLYINMTLCWGNT